MKKQERKGTRSVTITTENGKKNVEATYSIVAPVYETMQELCDDLQKLTDGAADSALGMVQLAIFGKYEALGARKAAQGEVVGEYSLEEIFTMSASRFSYKAAIEAQQDRLLEILKEIAELAQQVASGQLDAVAFAAELANLQTEQKSVQATLAELEEKQKEQNAQRKSTMEKNKAGKANGAGNQPAE